MAVASTRTAHAARKLAKKITKTTTRPHGNYDHSPWQWGVVHGITPGPTPTVVVHPDGSQHAVTTTPATPPVPGSGSVVVNTNPFVVSVTITGGVVTGINVSGSSTGATSGTFLVRPGGSISLVYTQAPTWSWANAQYAIPSVKYFPWYVPTVGDVVLMARGMNRGRTSRIVVSKLNGSASPSPLPLAGLDSDGLWSIGQNGFLWGGSTAPTIPLAEPGATPPVLGAGVGDFYICTGSGVLYQLGENGIWAPIAVQATTQSGTAYTLALTDAGTIVELTSADAVTVTVPPNGVETFAVGTQISLCQIGAGSVTVAAGDGVTLQSPAGLAIAAQYGTVVLRYRGSDTWLLSGDLSSS